MAHRNDEAFDSGLVNLGLAETVFAGGLHHLPTIGSTNTHALEQARSGAAHGSFYLADEQTAGRGRSDHQWHSAAAQGLYLSVLLRLPAEQVAWLPLIAGLAAYQAIQEVTGLIADLRWPNDILIGDKKVAGILVEATGAVAVLGIGINLHQQSFPEGLATAATSLDFETGTVVNRERLLVAFLSALDGELSGVDPEKIPARVARVSSLVTGRRVVVHGPQACVGVTVGLDRRGLLQILTADGMVTVTTGGIRAANRVEASE